MQLHTVQQAAKALSWSELSLRKLITDKKLAVVRLGRSVRIPQSELDRLATRGT
jgi:excisionase family DNA binding protein